MRILITGGTGLIGGHLARYLTKLDYKVSVMTKGDLLAENFYQLKDADVLIHCAWPTRIDLDATDHLEFAELSCHLFEEAKKNNVRVINLGSSSEYGQKDIAMREDMICEPHTSYGIAKLAVTLYAKKLGFNTLRLATVKGEGGHSFVDVAKKTDKYSSPYFKRSYTEIEHLVTYIERMIHAKHIYGEIFNCPAMFSIKNKEAIPHGLDFDDRWNKYPQRQFEPANWDIDSKKFMNTFAL